MTATDDVAFQVAHPIADRDALAAISIEYFVWVLDGVERSFGLTAQALLGMSPAEYAVASLDKVTAQAPPEGVFYLLRRGDRVAGMGGLRTLGPGLGEIKRVYVRPEDRGLGLARRLLARLVDDARAFGMDRLVLETAPFMREAHALYESYGFTDTGPYPGAEVPEPLHHGWRFMACALAAS